MAHAKLAEAQVRKRVFRSFDLGETRLVDVGTVREAARKTRRLRLLRVLHVQGRRQSADVGLVEAGVHQGRDDAVVGRRLQARPVVAEVVRVGAVEDVVEAFLLGDAFQGVVERRLAVEAAVHRIGAVGRIRHFVGDDHAVAHAPFLRQFSGQLEVAALQALRAGGDGKRVFAQGGGGNVGDQRTVDAAGEGDQDAPQGADVRLQLIVLGAKGVVHSRLMMFAK